MGDKDSEILLRAAAGRIEFHHRLNEAVSLLELLNMPGITSLAEAKLAVATRIDALLTLGGQLPGPSGQGQEPAPAKETRAIASESSAAAAWPRPAPEDTCH